MSISLSCLLLTSLSSAQDLTIIEPAVVRNTEDGSVSRPTYNQVRPGSLVTIQGAGGTQWMVWQPMNLAVTSDDLADGTRRLFFTTPSDKSRILIWGLYPGDPVPRMRGYIIDVTDQPDDHVDPQPPPGPGPQPKPEPQPQPPDVPNRLGLGKNIYALTMKIPTRKQYAEAVGDVYNSVASNLVAVATADIDAEIAAIKPAVRALIADADEPQWDEVGNYITAAVRKLVEDGTVDRTSRDAVAAMLREMGAAFKLAGN